MMLRCLGKVLDPLAVAVLQGRMLKGDTVRVVIPGEGPGIGEELVPNCEGEQPLRFFIDASGRAADE
jgi:hypothetical protein